MVGRVSTKKQVSGSEKPRRSDNSSTNHHHLMTNLNLCGVGGGASGDRSGER